MDTTRRPPPATPVRVGVRARVHGRRRPQGVTLVELMVAMVIGLVLTLAVVAVLTRSEGLKRTTTSVNDVNQSAATLSYLLDRQLRSAGSGFAPRWRETFGCRLLVSRNLVQILPRPASMPLPAPFTGVRAALGAAGVVRLAPVLIGKDLAPGGGGDVLMVMTGTGGIAETPVRVNTASATAASVLLPSTLGLRANDLVMLADAGTGDCLLQQVGPAFVQAVPPGQLLPFAGRYAAAAIGGVNLADLSVTGQTFAALIGNAVDNFPQFQLIGVGANATLFGYDLLRAADVDQALPLAEGVVEMRALYGVTNTPAGTVDAWIDPADDAANWGLAALTNGTAASRDRLRSIVSVRVGLVMRTGAPEAGTVAPATLTLFPDLPAALQQTRTLTAAEQRMRHRVVDFTVPLRTVRLQDR